MQNQPLPELEVVDTTDGRHALLVREDVLNEVEARTGQDFMEALRERLRGMCERLSELCLCYGKDEAERRLLEEYGMVKSAPPAPDRQFDMARSLHVLEQWQRNPRIADALLELRRLLSDEIHEPVKMAAEIVRYVEANRIELHRLLEEIQFVEPRSQLTEAVLRHYRM